MEHSFDIDIATEVGVNAAILYNNIKFWCAKNRANNVHFHDDYYWTYNSTKAFSELFPYLTEKQITYALGKLIEHGYIIKGKYNTAGYDQTLWYADIKVDKNTEKPIESTENTDLTRLSNGNDSNVKPIPYINTNTKTKTLSKDNVRNTELSSDNFFSNDISDKKKNKRKTNDEELLDAYILIDNFTNIKELKEKLKELFRNKKEECSKNRYHFSATTCKTYSEDLENIDDKLGAVKLSLQYNNTMKVMEPNKPFNKSENNKFIHPTKVDYGLSDNDYESAKDENGNIISF